MREKIVAALDVGSRKICCFIAKTGGDLKRPQVIGIGHQESRGVKSGTVVDMEETETAIRAAVDSAERMAGGSPIQDVIVSLSAGEPQSRHFSVDVEVDGHEISEQDIDQVLELGQSHMQNHDRFIIHSRPTSYSIDGVSGVKEPRGMFGEKLGVELHMVSVAASPLRNLQSCISRCHLNMAGAVLSPYASGLAALVPDERELGSICIDMGGGVTSIAAFKDGEFIYGDVVALGGDHVSRDIAQGLSTPMQSAERLKTMFGTCAVGQPTARNQIDITQVGDSGQEQTTTIPRSMLTSIISPRIEEIFEIVHDRIRRAGMEDIAGRRLIITGGGSQLGGIEESAKKIFGQNVRLGRPLGVDGLADLTAGPTFSTCAGLLTYVDSVTDEVHYRERKQPMVGVISRINQWFRTNF